MPKFKAALIGGGNIADKNHIPALKQLSDLVEIVAVCSRDESKARALADQHGIPHAFADAAEMYRQCSLNLVINCTPNNLHYPYTMQALENGCHVLCEKPPALRAHEAREMAELASRKGLVLAYNLTAADQRMGADDAV
jgi:predicted dehydrogenase